MFSTQSVEDTAMDPNATSIICTEIDEALNKKEFLYNHFSKFGKILGINSSRSNKYAIVHFASPVDAKKAKDSGGQLHPDYPPVDIFFSAKTPTTRKSSSTSSKTQPTTSTRSLRSKQSTLFGSVLLAKAAKEKGMSSESGFRLNRTRTLPSASATRPKSPEEEGEILDGIGNEESAKTEQQPPQNFSIFGNKKFSFTLPNEQSGSQGIFRGSSPFPSVQSLFPSAQKTSEESKPTTSPVKQQKQESKPDKPFSITFGGRIFGNENVEPSAPKPGAVPPLMASFLKAKPSEEIQRSSGPELKRTSDRDKETIAVASLQELLCKRSCTADEKYKILEARDKILRMKNPKVKIRVEEAVVLVGTCPDMCPEKERYMREAQHQLSMYEFAPGRDYEVDHTRAVKAYSRSSADQEEPLSHELRSSPILDLTVNYLLHNIISRVENEGENLAEWYNFVWDRTRSIRKDITQQQLCDFTSVALMEKCARFHIFCSSRLCELDRHSFDPKLNDENLMKCLQSLEHMYSDLLVKGTRCPNEPEFRSYQILMNLNEGDILWEIQQKDEWILQSSQVQLALKIYSSVFDKNFVAFFRLVKKAPFLTSCIVHRYFYQVRLKALKSLIKAHSVPPKFEAIIDMSTVQKMLGYGSFEDFLLFCEDHGITCDASTGKLRITRRQLQVPENPVTRREVELIDSKLICPVSDAINGSPLGPSLPYTPNSSFDQHGFLKDKRKLSEEEIDKNILTKVATPISQQIFQPRLAPVFGAFPVPFTPPKTFDKETIEKVAEEKKNEILEEFVNSEVNEIAKGATFLYQKQMEIKLASNLISSQILGEIEEKVVGDLTREISWNELNIAKVSEAIANAVEVQIRQDVVLTAVTDVCSQILKEKQESYAETVRISTEKLKRVELTHWLNLWRENALKKSFEKIRIAQKRQMDRVHFPPALAWPIRPKNMRKSFPPISNLEAKLKIIGQKSVQTSVASTQSVTFPAKRYKTSNENFPPALTLPISPQNMANFPPVTNPMTKLQNINYKEDLQTTVEMCLSCMDRRKRTESSPPAKVPRRLESSVDELLKGLREFVRDIQAENSEPSFSSSTTG